MIITSLDTRKHRLKTEKKNIAHKSQFECRMLVTKNQKKTALHNWKIALGRSFCTHIAYRQCVQSPFEEASLIQSLLRLIRDQGQTLKKKNFQSLDIPTGGALIPERLARKT